MFPSLFIVSFFLFGFEKYKKKFPKKKKNLDTEKKKCFFSWLSRENFFLKRKWSKTFFFIILSLFKNQNLFIYIFFQVFSQIEKKVFRLFLFFCTFFRFFSKKNLNIESRLRFCFFSLLLLLFLCVSIFSLNKKQYFLFHLIFLVFFSFFSGTRRNQEKKN